LNRDQEYKLTTTPTKTPLRFYLASTKDATKKDEYLKRAVEQLHGAVTAGFKDRAQLATESDLDPLRDRADFKKLMEELEKKSPAEPELKP
jgi:hypothetical protein